MKKILFIAAALSLAVLQGCAERTTRQDKNKTPEATQSVDNHNHAPGEACPSQATHEADAETNEHRHDNHEGHSDDGHDHSHSGTSHEGHDHSHTGDSTYTEGEGIEDPDEIVFTAEQASRTDFEVREVKRGTFRETLRCGGDIYASQSDVSVVSAPIAGVVMFVDGHVMPNSTVSAGQGLFRLSSGGLASGDAVQKARIAFRQAEADFRRTEELYRDKLVTQRDYLSAEAEYLRAKAEYDPIKVADERGPLITSPSSGYVLQLSVAPGDYVEMGQPLATIAKSGRLQLRALVSQRYFDRLPYINDANFRIPSSTEYYTVSSLGGSLYTSGRAVAQGSALVPVVFEFNADRRFPDGAFAEVVLLGERKENVITVPLSAITEQQGLYYVYVQLDPDCYRRTQVWPGANDGINVEILRGLEEGETVVTKGAVNVKMAAASGAIPHGHTH